jgi:hypothetical protein
VFFPGLIWTTVLQSVPQEMLGKQADAIIPSFFVEMGSHYLFAQAGLEPGSS